MKFKFESLDRKALVQAALPEKAGAGC